MIPEGLVFQLVAALPDLQLAYSIPRFAAAVDLSVSTIRKAIDNGDLVPVYPATRKPLITKEEAARWLGSLAQEPQFVEAKDVAPQPLPDFE